VQFVTIRVYERSANDTKAFGCIAMKFPTKFAQYPWPVNLNLETIFSHTQHLLRVPSSAWLSVFFFAVTLDPPL